MHYIILADVVEYMKSLEKGVGGFDPGSVFHLNNVKKWE
jgi:hypothetical protein